MDHSLNKQWGTLGLQTFCKNSTKEFTKFHKKNPEQKNLYIMNFFHRFYLERKSNQNVDIRVYCLPKKKIFFCIVSWLHIYYFMNI